MSFSRDSDKTDPIVDPGTTAPPPHVFTSSVKLDIAGVSHPGLVRENNEDHFIISQMGRYQQTLDTNIPEDLRPPRFEESFYGMIVADGVGGGAAGEVASRTAIRAILQLGTTSPNWFFRMEDPGSVKALLDRLHERMGQIHETLIDEARQDPSLKGFGTTMTLGLSIGNVLFLAHIGDSRVYLLRGGSLQQLTRDHTLAQDLADKGFDTGHGVPVEQLRHVLTQALTDHDRPLEPQVQAVELEDGDRILFCTDGLSDLIPDEVIASTLGSDRTSEQIGKTLIERALEAGGKDNVTVVVAAYRITAEA